MKRTGILVLILLFGFMSASAQKSSNKDKRPVIKFEETTHNFGEISYKGDGTCEFTFENKGKEPLLLTKVRSSCGCTVPNSWPKQPIKPGEEGTIKVKYNTRIRGSFSKSIMIYSNAKNNPVRLVIKGKVVTNKEK
jgi:hypothetical protein